MGAYVPYRVAFRLSNLNYTILAGPPLLTFLWTVFFKIDGETVVYDPATNHLQGSAIVVGTPGDHGDLGDSENPKEFIQIPPQLGAVRLRLFPYPLKGFPTIAVADGYVGCVAILVAQHGTPDEAIQAGHLELNSALAAALDITIPELGPMQPPAGQEKTDIVYFVEEAVKKAISDNTSFWQALGAGFGHDIIIDEYVLLFSNTKATPLPTAPTGIPLQYTFAIAGKDIPVGLEAPVTANPAQTWQLTGLFVADPWDFSLRRDMLYQRLDPSKGVRTPMAAVSVSSVRTWIQKTSPTWH